MVVSRMERGLGRVDLDALQRIGLAFSQPVVVTFGRDMLEVPVDAGHLAIQELVLRLAREAGYAGAFETPTRPADPWRSVDVSLRDASRGLAVLVECWNSIGDIGAAARSTMRKLADIAGQMPEDRVRGVWVVRATARNRALVERYPEVFASRFPGSSRGWLEALTSGSSPPVEPGLVWCDVAATRLFGWRQRRTPLLHSPPHGRDREE
jgi:hypothetical protein